MPPSSPLNAPTDAFLQTNPLATLTLANACPEPADAGVADPPLQALTADDLQRLPGLQQRVLRRLAARRSELRCLGGVDATALQQGLQALLAGDDALAALFQPAAASLLQGARDLPLPSVVVLLLTAARCHQPAAWQHALRAMALAGAIAWHAKAPPKMLLQAMLVGLVHDIGEMYVTPSYLNAGRQLDLAECRQLAAHPQVGALLIGELTDLPAEIARAVREHHERLDGTGYPFQCLAPALSPLGQLMAVAELALGVFDGRPHAAQRASFALKFVPGELTGLWAGPITHWADTGPRAEPDRAQADAALDQLAALQESLPALESLAQALAQTLTGAAQRVAQRAAHRLQRLRMAWNAMGLWSLDAGAIEPQERFDIALAMRELRYRLGTIGRDCLWPESDPAVQGDVRLVPLWLALSRAGQPPR